MPEAPAEITPAQDAQPTDAPDAPWGSEFDAEKAWGLITNLREENAKIKNDRVPQDEKDAKTITALKRQLEEAKPKLTEYDKLVEASKTETERAQDAAAAAQQRVQQITTRAVQAEVKALAATRFADPSDAAAFLDHAKYINDDGEIDTAGIEADLAELLVRKPHLGTAPGGRPPAPLPGQGASEAGTAGQLTQADLDGLARDNKYAEIEKARVDGRLNTLLGIKT